MTGHHNTTGHGSDSGVMQQLHSGTKRQGQSKALPRPSKVKSSTYKASP